MKSTFNVCFFKSFGSKQLFWHLVKVGPDTQDLTKMLEAWRDARISKDYMKLQTQSDVKSEEVARIKMSVTRTRYELYRAVANAKEHGAFRQSCKEVARAEEAHQTAKRNWKYLQRSTQHKGLHEWLHV